MMAAAGYPARSITVAAAGRAGVGRSRHAVSLAKSGKGAQQAFSPPAVPAFRAFYLFILGANPAQTVVGRAAIGTSVSIYRHSYIYLYLS